MSFFDQLEKFANSGDNCGIGPNGFEHGNTCAKGGQKIVSSTNGMSREEFESHALSEEESSSIIMKIRAGDERSKNKGSVSTEKTKKLVLTRIPLSVFDEEYRQFIEETTDKSRVERYVKENVRTPVYATPKRRGDGFSVSDGGHRLMAAIKRGDTHINAYVPVDSFDRLKMWNEREEKSSDSPNKNPENFMSFFDQLEKFAYSGENCGIGSNGFEKGNKCATSKGGKKTADAPKIPTNAAEARKFLKSQQAKPQPTQPAANPPKAAKAPAALKTSKAEPKNAEPSPSGPSDRGAAATKPKVDTSPNVKAQPESIASGTVPQKQEQMSERAEKALKYHKPVTTEQKSIARDREQDVAKGLGGQWLPDHEPVDVILLDDKGEEVGIEVKTTFDNTRGSLTIDAAANLYKVDWRKERKGTKTRIDIVVCDDKTGDMYYKRGVGSFTFSGMYKVPGGYKGGMEHLKKLVAMKESDKEFPAEAKYQKDTINHVALIDKLTYGVLKKQALDAKLAKDARRAKSKEKMKGQK